MAQERPALVIIQTQGSFCGIKKRGSIVAWRGTGFALSVRSCIHIYVYCKRFLPVSLKYSDEHGVDLLRSSKNPKERILLCWSNIYWHGNQNVLLELQITFMHMWFGPFTLPLPLTLINGWWMRWGQLNDIGTINATLRCFSQQIEWDWTPHPHKRLESCWTLHYRTSKQDK